MWLFDSEKLRRRRKKGSVPAPPEWSLRPAGPEDGPFLREMVLAAAFWRDDDERPPLHEAFADPMLRRYVEGWGRDGDRGSIAVEGGGRPIGACWIRRFSAGEPGYGFVAEQIPELGICVLPEHRGRGIGGRLLQAVLEDAERTGVRAVSLSVAADNPAVRLYERHGFVRVGFDGHSYTMRAALI